MRRFSLRTLILATMLAPAAIAGLWWICQPSTRGRRIETLNSPVAVIGWNSQSLALADGRKVPLPGLRALPTAVNPMSEFLERGVEVAPDGRVYALVRVHHWCGNDRVREHVAKVDLADALMFLQIGDPVQPATERLFTVNKPGGSFSTWGWNYSEFLDFQTSLALRRYEESEPTVAAK